MKKKKNLSLKGREAFYGIMFISPWIIGIIVFFLYNLIGAFAFSLNTIDTTAGLSFTWVGLRNFRVLLLEHGTFNRTLVDSMVLIFTQLPLIIFFSLFMAILLNRKFLGRGLVRAIFFLPVILATTAIQGPMNLVMQLMLGGVSALPPELMQQQQGFNAQIVIMTLASFNVPPQIIGFLVTAIAGLHDVIRASGVQIIIFLAALQAIPPSMYEVAQIEGATGYEIFWKITIPLVSPLILTNVVYTIVDRYAQSGIVNMAHSFAFTQQQFGLSSAMSVVSSAVILLLMGLLVWAISKRVFYYND